MGKQAVLPVKATLNKSGFTAGLKAMKKDVGWFAKGLSGFAKGIMGITGASAAAGIAVGGVLAVGFTHGIKGALDLGGTLEDLKNQTGESAGNLLLFQQVLKDNGVEAEAAGTTLNKMSKAIVAAAEEGAGAVTPFTKLGISIDDLLKKSPVEQFKAVGVALGKITDPAKRGALAMDVFGRAGGKLLGALGDAQGFETAARSLGRQAAILSANSAAFDQVSDRLARTGLKLQGFFVGAASTMLPALDALTEKLDGMDFAAQGERFGAAIEKAAVLLAGIQSRPLDAQSVAGNTLKGAAGSVGNWLAAPWEKGVKAFKAVNLGVLDAVTGNVGQGWAKMQENLYNIYTAPNKDVFGASGYLDAARDSAKNLKEAGAENLTATSEYCSGLRKTTKQLTSASSLNTGNSGLFSGGLGGDFARTFSANADVRTMGKGSGHLLFSAKERRAFEDAAVRGGGERSASSVGAYNTVRRGDAERKKQHEKDVALGKNGVEKSNELLERILKPTVDTANTLKSWDNR